VYVYVRYFAKLVSNDKALNV